MRISHSHRFVFLAYPRTASRTIRAMLDEWSDIRGVHATNTTPEFPFYHHMTAIEVQQAFVSRGWRWEDYRKFCVVRNPYDRIVSLFKRRSEHEARWDPRLRPVNNVTSMILRFLPSRLAFPLFVNTRKPHYGVACNLSTFANDKNNHPLVEEILRFENLDSELPEYLNSLGIEVSQGSLPRLNVSQNQSAYQAWYTAGTIKRVEEMYSYEMERFAYSFEA